MGHGQPWHTRARLLLLLRTKNHWHVVLLLTVLALCLCSWLLLQPRLPPPNPFFDRDLQARASSFVERCERQDANNPFHGLWSAEEIADLCHGTVVISNFFNSKPEYQKVSGWGTQQRVSTGGTPIADLDESGRFKYMQKWYDSVQKFDLCAIIFHDTPGERGQWYQREKGTAKIRFVRVDPVVYDSVYSRKFGLNDVRCQFVHQALCADSGWKWAFYTDIYDVTVGRSPIGEPRHDIMYVGTDSGAIGSDWLEEGFTDIGGAYLDFWRAHLARGKKRMWNPGVLGGERTVLLGFLAKYLAVLTDPNIAMNWRWSGTPRSHWGFQNVNMPAVNYVCERFYPKVCYGGPPLNSEFRGFQVNRSDVWFIHK